MPSASGGRSPPDLPPGALPPGSPLGARPPTLVIGSRSRARHTSPLPQLQTTPDAPDSDAVIDVRPAPAAGTRYLVCATDAIRRVMHWTSAVLAAQSCCELSRKRSSGSIPERALAKKLLPWLAPWLTEIFAFGPSQSSQIMTCLTTVLTWK